MQPPGLPKSCYLPVMQPCSRPKILATTKATQTTLRFMLPEPFWLASSCLEALPQQYPHETNCVNHQSCELGRTHPRTAQHCTAQHCALDPPNLRTPYCTHSRTNSLRMYSQHSTVHSSTGLHTAAHTHNTASHCALRPTILCTQHHPVNMAPDTRSTAPHCVLPPPSKPIASCLQGPIM